MDILAHGLWAWAGGEMLRRRHRITTRTLVAGVGFALAPDLLQMLPVLAGVLLGQVSLGELYAYATANPGQEPILQYWVSEPAHHAHCAFHSVLVAGLVSMAAWWYRPAWLYPLLGWWLHIATDIPTHSAEYYAVPLFYPITERGFDGFAWTSPWFIALNYTAITGVAMWLYATRRS